MNSPKTLERADGTSTDQPMPRRSLITWKWRIWFYCDSWRNFRDFWRYCWRNFGDLWGNILRIFGYFLIPSSGQGRQDSQGNQGSQGKQGNQGSQGRPCNHSWLDCHIKNISQGIQGSYLIRAVPISGQCSNQDSQGSILIKVVRAVLLSGQSGHWSQCPDQGTRLI